MISRQPGQRIVIVGTTGSGKTTIARHLSDQLHIPHIELDSLFWGPDWQSVGSDEFRRRVASVVEAPVWIIDGNYHMARDIIWSRATDLVWLDYSLSLVFMRLVRRTLGRVISGEELWHGNRENIRGTFFSKDSILWFAVRTHRRRRRDITASIHSAEYNHLKVTRLRNPRQTEAWLQTQCTRSQSLPRSEAVTTGKV